MPRRSKKAVSSWRAATALAVVGGTGLFAAAAAVQRRTVRVPVPGSAVHVHGQCVAGQCSYGYSPAEPPNEGDTKLKNDTYKVKRSVGNDDDEVTYIAKEMFDDDFVEGIIDETIKAIGKRFTPDGRRLVIRTIISGTLHDRHRRYFKGQGTEYLPSLTRLKEYISNTVTEFSQEPSVCHVCSR
jgi:hypothetical protein